MSVFSPRVVGVAVARYDFSSRDTRELSLLQGDVIRIYSKMSNGWWKGEVGGRVENPIPSSAFAASGGADMPVLLHVGLQFGVFLGWWGLNNRTNIYFFFFILLFFMRTE